MELDDLVGLKALRFVHGLGIKATETKIAFGPDHEEGLGLIEMIETIEVQIAPVEKVNGPGLDEEIVEQVDFVDLAMGYEDNRGNAASQVHEGMKFDGSFAFSEMRPGEKRQAEIDGSCIEGINGLFQFEAQIPRWHKVLWLE